MAISNSPIYNSLTLTLALSRHPQLLITNMFSYLDPQCLYIQELNTVPPTLKPYPSMLFPFSPPSFQDSTIQDLLNMSSAPHPSLTKPATETYAPPIANKRAPRKDRYTKIVTAQGPRDRRMRLSLDVARKFFNLQDTLGFDKASKTVQWLLDMSLSAIKDHKERHTGSESLTTSECKNLSRVSNYKAEKPPSSCKGKRVTASSRASRKPAPDPILARESRSKARARARERTRAKKRTNRGGNLAEDCSDEQNQQSPSNDHFAIGAGSGLPHISGYSHNLVDNNGATSFEQLTGSEIFWPMCSSM